MNVLSMSSLCADNVDHIKLRQCFKSGIINFPTIEMIHTMTLLVQTFFGYFEVNITYNIYFKVTKNFETNNVIMWIISIVEKFIIPGLKH